MIYKYKCVDCGKEMEGQEICFDLAEMLELQGISSRLSLVDFQTLARWAGDGVDLYQEGRYRIAITLQEFLVVLGKNSIKHEKAATLSEENLKREIEQIEGNLRKLPYSELEEKGLGRLIRSTVNEAEKQKIVRAYKTAIDSRFVPQFDELDNNSNQEDMTKYCAFLWVEPVFFPEEVEVYSLRYSIEEDPVNLREIAGPREIRGYCPKCGAPVIKGAGMYPHRLVGILGAQSAGKTSLIISLIDEMVKHFDEYGIEFPKEEYLCDSRFYTIWWNLECFRKGWAVAKTVASAGERTFNASMLLKSRQNPADSQIITFVDIAGELCYDTSKRAFNPEAMKRFPLIPHCDLYLVCSCIDRNSYGEIDENGQGECIDENAVLTVATGIYDWHKKAKGKQGWGIPPLCVVMTKADLTREPVGEKRENPFDKILGSKEVFFHRAAVERLRDYYVTSQSEDIRIPLRWCVKTYEEMEEETYISMMSCSALGKTRKQYPVENIEIIKKAPENEEEKQKLREYLRSLYRRPVQPNEESSGESMGLEELWGWLLAVLGLTSVRIGDKYNQDILPDREYTLPHIPSYNDSYKTEKKGRSACRRVFDITEAVDRIQAVDWLFINFPDKDKSLLTEYISAGRGWRFWQRVTWERRIQVISECVDSWN